MSLSIQADPIHLQLISTDNGKVVFEEDGGILQSYVTKHNSRIQDLTIIVIFADGCKIETDDVAQISSVASDVFPPGSFTITETICKLLRTN